MLISSHPFAPLSPLEPGTALPVSFAYTSPARKKRWGRRKGSQEYALTCLPRSPPSAQPAFRAARLPLSPPSAPPSAQPAFRSARLPLSPPSAQPAFRSACLPLSPPSAKRAFRSARLPRSPASSQPAFRSARLPLSRWRKKVAG
ncbi:unnamed protein product [Closterium sp. NIES-53]